MRFCFSIILLAVLLLGAAAGQAAAHVIDEAVTLGFNGWLAPFGDSGAEEYTDVWAEGNLAYLGTVGSGVAVINLDTGAYESGVLKNPEFVTAYAPAGHADFQDVKVDNGIGYFSGGSGTDIVDLSAASAPALLTRIGAAQGGFPSTKNAAVGGGYLYQVSTTSSEIRVFDVSVPASPSLVRSIDTNDPIGLHDATLQGDRLYVAGAGGGSYVYDVAGVGATEPLLQVAAPTGAATSSVWPTANGDKLVVTHHEPGGELSLWDIASTPTLLDSQSAGDMGFNSYSTSEVAVVGSLAYVAWSQGGLQVVDLDNTEESGMQRAGYYTIVGSGAPTSLTGVRSVYPFLGWDQVLASDTKRGLWRFDSSMLNTHPVGDYNLDGQVDTLDYDTWASHYGSASPYVDGNGDGVVDAADFTVWRDAYTAATATPSAIQAPEPTTYALILLGLLAAVSDRRLTLGRSPQ
ncbi:LVIVD repeat protein [Pseudobythopirellula maris]|uniref:LVIVD repeat protein n=1 Tax=Pseudobythopirellula maris TaxID=2527991 RepID=A0A5C5ZKG1_9BACT|nr:hypothetical protein [Pseudobythopirellula maris]TWT87710.1 LVIVD repeat protein [Pseudobythopirellula maris]